MGQRQIRSPWLTDVIATTDATPTVSSAATYSTPTSASGFMDVHYSIKGTNLIASGTKRILWRNNAGTVTILTALVPLAIGGDAGLLTAVVDLVTGAAGSVQPRVTGIIATNLSFQIDCQYSVD